MSVGKQVRMLELRMLEFDEGKYTRTVHQKWNLLAAIFLSKLRNKLSVIPRQPCDAVSNECITTF